jgi:hypothetical protein
MKVKIEGTRSVQTEMYVCPYELLDVLMINTLGGAHLYKCDIQGNLYKEECLGNDWTYGLAEFSDADEKARITKIVQAFDVIHEALS